MNDEEKLETRLRNIIDNNTPKSITYDGKKVYISKDKIQEIKKLEKEKKEGGILPLVALLPLIFGGLTAAGATAGGVATVVQKAKESQKNDAEKKLAQVIAEKIQTGQVLPSEHGSGIYLDRYRPEGQGIFLNSHQGQGITKYLKNICKDNDDENIKQVLKKLGKGDIEISTSGDGIFLNPYDTRKPKE